MGCSLRRHRFFWNFCFSDTQPGVAGTKKVAQSVCGWGRAKRAPRSYTLIRWGLASLDPSHPYSKFLDRFTEDFLGN
uniref:Uncharacterized protein n=1 Tax=Candidatus Kentrum sp. UNK TaxID=2126344 RepID=A0A451A9X0_9GAMM|nr:MAG: hypothetical protein BECKUNK1418G_GA0071005_102723 [Candidatus Kentron sp. UNK]VFK70626.1 MAG: hypothetical protein BECKUNK1418H_GA0071006_103413 [Candidatus Kentron sp. UNK]